MRAILIVNFIVALLKYDSDLRLIGQHCVNPHCVGDPVEIFQQEIKVQSQTFYFATSQRCNTFTQVATTCK